MKAWCVACGGVRKKPQVGVITTNNLPSIYTNKSCNVMCSLSQVRSTRSWRQQGRTTPRHSGIGEGLSCTFSVANFVPGYMTVFTLRSDTFPPQHSGTGGVTRRSTSPRSQGRARKKRRKKRRKRRKRRKRWWMMRRWMVMRW